MGNIIHGWISPLENDQIGRRCTECRGFGIVVNGDLIRKVPLLNSESNAATPEHQHQPTPSGIVVDPELYRGMRADADGDTPLLAYGSHVVFRWVFAGHSRLFLVDKRIFVFEQPSSSAYALPETMPAEFVTLLTTVVLRVTAADDGPVVRRGDAETTVPSRPTTSWNNNPPPSTEEAAGRNHYASSIGPRVRLFHTVLPTVLDLLREGLSNAVVVTPLDTTVTNHARKLGLQTRMRSFMETMGFVPTDEGWSMKQQRFHRELPFAYDNVLEFQQYELERLSRSVVRTTTLSDVTGSQSDTQRSQAMVVSGLVYVLTDDDGVTRTQKSKLPVRASVAVGIDFRLDENVRLFSSGDGSPNDAAIVRMRRIWEHVFNSFTEQRLVVVSALGCGAFRGRVKGVATASATAAAAVLRKPEWRARFFCVVFCIPTFGSGDTTYDDFCAAFERGPPPVVPVIITGRHGTINVVNYLVDHSKTTVGFLVAGEASAVVEGRIGKRWMGGPPASVDEVTSMQTTLLLFHRDVNPEVYARPPKILTPPPI